MRKVILIEAPSNLGLKELHAGIEPGVKFFPDAMEQQNFSKLINAEKKLRVTPPAYSMETDVESKVRNAQKIVDYSKQLAGVIEENMQSQNIPVVIGGDCSILIGAALVLKKNGNYGLFFTDGHTDYVLPEQSGTAGAAGMDLAIVTGSGHDKLTNITNLKPYLKEENVFCCGNRELSADWYVNAIIESDIHYFDLYDLRKKGVNSITSEFLSMITSKKLDGFWVHLDVDVLNNNVMPCVDSPQEDGLNYDELKQILHPLLTSRLFTGIDITIFDPTLDYDDRYGKQLATELANVFKTLY